MHEEVIVFLENRVNFYAIWLLHLSARLLMGMNNKMNNVDVLEWTYL